MLGHSMEQLDTKIQALPAVKFWKLAFDSMAEWPLVASDSSEAADAAAAADPSAAAAQSICLEAWLDVASDLALVDIITAEPIFHMICAGASAITEERFERFTQRLSAKAALTSTWSSLKPAKAALAKEQVAESSMLLSGGMPSYIINECTVTPRVGATLVLTESSLYFRPLTLGFVRTNKLQRFALDGSDSNCTLARPALPRSWDAF